MTAVAGSPLPDTLDDALSELQETVSLMFARARVIWRETAALVHPELSPLGYKLLSHIARCEGTNAVQLAERFETDKSVISRQVRMLEEFGLAQSRPDERDGRLRVLTATDEARIALSRSFGGHAERMRTVLTDLDPDEIRTAAKVFRLLSEA